MSMAATTTELSDRHGFVRADCAACQKQDVWLTCNECKKADRFVLESGRAVCACGSVYTFATCTCGATVPKDRLVWVPFNKGPLNLGDWEFDRRRIAVLAVIGVAIFGAGTYLIYTLAT